MNPTATRTAEAANRFAASGSAAQPGRRPDRLLALLVHELRNPLTAVRNSVSILRLQGCAGPIAARALDQLDRQSQQLNRLLEELMDLSQLLQGRLALHKERVYLPAIIAQVEAALRPLFTAQDVHLEIASVPADWTLAADPARLGQIVRALLLRALKYTPAGGQVWLMVQREEETVTVRIRDNGFGIAPEVLAHFFELGDEAPAEHLPGTAGTSLHLARGLAHLHGGTIEVASAGPGQGSELTLRLPLAEAGAAPAKEDHLSPLPRAVRVLCVDDDPDIADSLAQLLRDKGHEAWSAHSGPEALKLAGKHRPEVVLLDLELPGMDGYELAGRLRQQPGLEGVCLVAVSGYGSEEEQQRTKAAGMIAHLVKPIKAAELEHVLALSASREC
jgi:CheY-like chemotaxis protein